MFGITGGVGVISESSRIYCTVTGAKTTAR